MNNEIKEILDNIKDKYEDYYVQDIVSGNDLKQLLDYIINLQKQIEEYQKALDETTSEKIDLQQKVEQYENPDDLTLFYMWVDEKAKDKMKALQEENEHLKKQNNGLHNLIVQHIDEEDNLIDYKSRIDKAVEYIMTELIDEWNIKNNGYVSGSDLPADAIIPLLNILNGDEDEYREYYK